LREDSTTDHIFFNQYRCPARSMGGGNSNKTILKMKRKTFEELELLKQDGRIGWVEYLQQSEYSESYRQWLADRGAEPDEDNAELFVEQTDAAFLESQDLIL
jgi:hypothetical protein